jgi:hypothetical protein
MNKNRIGGVSVGRAGESLRSPLSIKDAERRSGDCARKAVEITSGDLPEAEVSRGHIRPGVGKAIEALQAERWSNG